MCAHSRSSLVLLFIIEILFLGDVLVNPHPVLFWCVLSFVYYNIYQPTTIIINLLYYYSCIHKKYIYSLWQYHIIFFFLLLFIITTSVTSFAPPVTCGRAIAPLLITIVVAVTSRKWAFVSCVHSGNNEHLSQQS